MCIKHCEVAVPPLVSICIPTYNGARFIEETLRSALTQKYEPLEIVIVDDASTDHTLDIVRSLNDPRIRVEVNHHNLGHVRNWNRCLRLSAGSLVKFLFQDDLLYPTCVEKMARVFELHKGVGMVFSPRDVLLENPDDPKAVAWKNRCGTLHARFVSLGEVNRGIDLFNQWLARGFRENWVGEPSSVMIRRACVEKVGLFNTSIYQFADAEMWMRLMYFYDVGFINEPLSAFRFHSASATSANVRENLHWLDTMWTLEGLLSREEIRNTHPQIKLLRYPEAARVVRRQIRRIGRQEKVPVRSMIRSLAEYLAFVLGG
jgi:glycosyltransferase involved in cell wall biosynthesis